MLQIIPSVAAFEPPPKQAPEQSKLALAERSFAFIFPSTLAVVDVMSDKRCEWCPICPPAAWLQLLTSYVLDRRPQYIKVIVHYRHCYKAIIFANDHNDDARALLLAARTGGVPTAYVQHASVSTYFPPLSFDLNLLEGQDALDKYRQCGPIRGQVELVGMPKADAYLSQRNTASAVQRVGIAVNLLDDTDAIRTAVDYLIREFPTLTFTFRAHPGDTRDFSFLREHTRLQFSNARQQNVFEFLQQQDALIAADTSTHLEATLLNLASLYYRFGTHTVADDYYGYVAHGLVERALTLSELAALLRRYEQHKPVNLYQRAAYYNSTLGTSDEGASKGLTLRKLAAWIK